MQSAGLVISTTESEGLELALDGRPLLRYIWKPDISAQHSPRPYFDPIWTLNGLQVTESAPDDHPWHYGLSMTCANLSGLNFWGGPTYLSDRGYVQLPNNGGILHRSWDHLAATPEQFSGMETLEWVAPDDRPLVRENRAMSVSSRLIDERAWILDLRHRMFNVSGKALEFGSPTSAGRPAAGYGGLFWRAAPCFKDSDVLTPGPRAADPMGRRAPWLALQTPKEATEPATVLLIDHPDNPRYPCKWFVRTHEYAGASFSFMFDEVYRLEPGMGMTLRYRLVIADGKPSEHELEGATRAYSGDVCSRSR